MLQKYLTTTKNPSNVGMMDVEEPSRSPSLPWVQKYRPSTLDELVSQQEIKKSLTGVLKSGNLPHLLLYGPAGTGKTSAMLAMIKQLYGPGFSKSVLELNASDERGIGVVRTKIKDFSSRMVDISNKNSKAPRYNIIILDEADSMTGDAQSALRRIMEDYSKTTRFAIICNYVTKIIEPIASRCVKFRFKPIPQHVQILKLQEICHNQNLPLSEETLRTILSNGDLRKSINTLQTLKGIKIIPEVIPTPQSVFQYAFGKLRRLSDIQEVVSYVHTLQKEQIPFDQLLVGLLRQSFKIRSEIKKARIAELIAKTDQRINLGCAQVQLLSTMTSIFFVLNQKQ